MTNEIIPMSSRINLCESEVTVNGHRAKISGSKNKFATLHNLETGESSEWSWNAVSRVVSKGGSFQS